MDIGSRKTVSKEMPDLAEFYTTQEAADKLGFHVKSVQYMVKNKTLDGVKVGGKTWLISKESVAEYLKKTDGMSKNDPRRKSPK